MTPGLSTELDCRTKQTKGSPREMGREELHRQTEARTGGNTCMGGREGLVFQDFLI